MEVHNQSAPTPEPSNLNNANLPQPQDVVEVQLRDSAFNLSLSMGAGEVHDLRLTCKDQQGAAVGTIEIKDLLVEQLEDFFDKLEARNDPRDLLSSHTRLSEALAFLEEHKIPWRSDLGHSASEASNTYGEKLLKSFDKETWKKLIALEEVLPGLYHINLPTQFLCCSLFIRFQEHYESPKYRARVFSFDDFKDYYRKGVGEGSFSYMQDWNGFNFPGWVLESFREGLFGHLSPAEEAFLEVTARMPEECYIIGTHGEGRENLGCLEHEIAHGLYHLNEKYRARVDEVLASTDTRELEAHLLEIGYCQQVIPDENHAYTLCEFDYLTEHEVDIAPLTEAHDKLQQIFKEFTAPIAARLKE